MRPHRASLTAAAVAFYRGLESIDANEPSLFHDEFAGHLLGGPAQRLLVALQAMARTRPTLRPSVQSLFAPLSHHIALRTAAIDATLRDAIEDGFDQVVIVGAGLDARAWRLAELASVDVFEVDHPATQARKRERAAGLTPRARSVTWAAVDFERDALSQRLAEVGHDAARRTFWIWEGVTPYLPPIATRRTLLAMRARSAPHSRLIVSYARPGLVTLPPALQPVLRPVIDAAFRWIGEPLRGAMTTDAFIGLLASAGFGVIDEYGSGAWARHMGRPVPWLRVQERLILAAAE